MRFSDLVGTDTRPDGATAAVGTPVDTDSYLKEHTPDRRNNGFVSGLIDRRRLPGSGRLPLALTTDDANRSAFKIWARTHGTPRTTAAPPHDRRANSCRSATMSTRTARFSGPAARAQDIAGATIVPGVTRLALAGLSTEVTAVVFLLSGQVPCTRYLTPSEG